MDWRETAVVPDGPAPNEVAVDAIAGEIPAGQRVLLACRTIPFEIDLWVAKFATVVLTDRSLIIAKDRVFGHPKADRVIALEEITACGFNPLLGVGPTWEVTFTGKNGAAGTMYFNGPTQAEQVESELRAAASSVRAEATDPDLAEFHRRRVATRARPPGEAGKNLSPEQIVEESRRLRQQLDSGDLRSAWQRRVDLGYGAPLDGVPQADRFWFNAAPVIAALRLAGLKDHAMVAGCCGMAWQDEDFTDPKQHAAVEEFERRFSAND
jgi:hypothetical protein